MSDAEGIINAAAEATRMARAQGCLMDIHITRGWGRDIRIIIDPSYGPPKEDYKAHIELSDGKQTAELPAVGEDVTHP